MFQSNYNLTSQNPISMVDNNTHRRFSVNPFTVVTNRLQKFT